MKQLLQNYKDAEKAFDAVYDTLTVQVFEIAQWVAKLNGNRVPVQTEDWYIEEGMVHYTGFDADGDYCYCDFREDLIWDLDARRAAV